MMIVGSGIPTVGLTAQLIPFLGEIFYYATPENEWALLLQPHIKTWLVPQPAVWYFFEGLPVGCRFHGEPGQCRCWPGDPLPSPST